MTAATQPTQRQAKALAQHIAKTASTTEKEALCRWIEALMAIRASDIPPTGKTRAAFDLTRRSQIILPLLKMLGQEIKRRAWEDRGVASRLGIGGAALGVAVFGGQAAGIAALGTAVAVPLWVLFGAGAAVLGVIYEELAGKPLETPKNEEREKAEPLPASPPSQNADQPQ